MSTTTIASTSRRCRYPPSVYELTTPSSHITTSSTKIVQSMVAPFSAGPPPWRRHARVPGSKAGAMHDRSATQAMEGELLLQSEEKSTSEATDPACILYKLPEGTRSGEANRYSRGRRQGRSPMLHALIV